VLCPDRYGNHLPCFHNTQLFNHGTTLDTKTCRMHKNKLQIYVIFRNIFIRTYQRIGQLSTQNFSGGEWAMGTDPKAMYNLRLILKIML
jgi:hypothetical protein